MNALTHRRLRGIITFHRRLWIVGARSLLTSSSWSLDLRCISSQNIYCAGPTLTSNTACKWWWPLHLLWGSLEEHGQGAYGLNVGHFWWDRDFSGTLSTWVHFGSPRHGAEWGVVSFLPLYAIFNLTNKEAGLNMGLPLWSCYWQSLG